MLGRLTAAANEHSAKQRGLAHKPCRKLSIDEIHRCTSLMFQPELIPVQGSVVVGSRVYQSLAEKSTNFHQIALAAKSQNSWRLGEAVAINGLTTSWNAVSYR
jgi:hypothetical protein